MGLLGIGGRGLDKVGVGLISWVLVGKSCGFGVRGQDRWGVEGKFL